MSFLGLSDEAVRKHLPRSAQTLMGHLHMIRKGIRLTPEGKTVKMSELMNEAMKPDYDETMSV